MSPIKNTPPVGPAPALYGHMSPRHQAAPCGGITATPSVAQEGTKPVGICRLMPGAGSGAMLPNCLGRAGPHRAARQGPRPLALLLLAACPALPQQGEALITAHAVVVELITGQRAGGRGAVAAARAGCPVVRVGVPGDVPAGGGWVGDTPRMCSAGCWTASSRRVLSPALPPAPAIFLMDSMALIAAGRPQRAAGRAAVQLLVTLTALITLRRRGTAGEGAALAGVGSGRFRCSPLGSGTAACAGARPGMAGAPWGPKGTPWRGLGGAGRRLPAEAEAPFSIPLSCLAEGSPQSR